MQFVRFVHLLGFTLWIGGGLAAMLIAVRSRREPPAVRAGIYRMLVSVHTMVIGLGALLSVLSGVLLTMSLVGSGGSYRMAHASVWVMQLTGLLGGLLVLFVQLPTAVKLGGLAVVDDEGNMPPAFERFRKRSAWISATAGTLAVIALFAWAVL